MRKKEMTDADYVKHARQQLGMTQTEFADLLCVSQRTIKRLEAGGPMPETMRLSIVTVLGVIDRHTLIKSGQRS
jgi:DNA-binding transcriptional regulator YiaG